MNGKPGKAHRGKGQGEKKEETSGTGTLCVPDPPRVVPTWLAGPCPQSSGPFAGSRAPSRFPATRPETARGRCAAAGSGRGRGCFKSRRPAGLHLSCSPGAASASHLRTPAPTKTRTRNRSGSRSFSDVSAESRIPCNNFLR